MRCGVGRATFMETSIFVSRLGSTIFPFRRLRFMETSIFVTDVAQQFSLSVVGPSHPVVVPLRVARAAGADFLILGLSFLIGWCLPGVPSSRGLVI
jgi:hypothetical protein